MNEHAYDRMLRIKPSSGLQALSGSIHQNRYEATPYDALEVLVEEYELKWTDELVDYGCGKGRVSFFLHHHLQLTVTGVEVNGHLYKESLKNQVSYMQKVKKTTGSVRFERCLAEEYGVERAQNKFYFFNPFSIQIFMKVINNILRSVEQEPRAVDMILYYPTTEYLQFLHDRTAFELFMEIKVPKRFEQDENERFVIFRLS